jgi:hypothetical protein
MYESFSSFSPLVLYVLLKQKNKQKQIDVPKKSVRLFYNLYYVVLYYIILSFVFYIIYLYSIIIYSAKISKILFVT